MLPFRGTWRVWRAGLKGRSMKGKAKSCIWGRTSLCTCAGWELTTWKAALQRRPPVVLQDKTLAMTQQRTFTAKAANGILNCIRKSINSRWRKMMLPLYSAPVRSHLSSEPNCELSSTGYGPTGASLAQDHRNWSIFHMRRG